MRSRSGPAVGGPAAGKPAVGAFAAGRPAAALAPLLALLFALLPAVAPAAIDSDRGIQKSFRNENILQEDANRIEVRIPLPADANAPAKIEGGFDSANLIALGADDDFDPSLPAPEVDFFEDEPIFIAANGTLIDASRQRGLKANLPDIANLYFEGLAAAQEPAAAPAPQPSAFPLLSEVIATRERMVSKLGYDESLAGYSDRRTGIDRYLGGEGDELGTISRKLDLSTRTLEDLNRQLTPFTTRPKEPGAPAREPRREGKVRPGRQTPATADEEDEPGDEPVYTGGGGAFRWPVVAKRISSRFGWRIHPIYGRRKFHNGLDLAATYGRPITAAAGGTVEYAGWKSYYGKTVIIRHPNGLKTLYAHCSKLNVSRGQRVDAGARVASVGQTGLSTGPHLHFGVVKGGQFVNPLPFLR